jgi:uncharacterized protein (DUF2147 family)
MTSIRTITILAMLLTGPAASAAGVEGTWLRDDGNARVRIAPCGDKICATNLWIGDTSKGEAVGDKLIMSLSRDGESNFSGTAYDPKRDWSYSMTIKATDGALTTRGCVLGKLICRDVTWKAAQ